MKKLILVVTKGCKACDIMFELVTKTLLDSRTAINVEVIDIADLDKSVIKDYKINDCPSLVFIKDNVVKHTICGTAPQPIIKKYLNQVL